MTVRGSTPADRCGELELGTADSAATTESADDRWCLRPPGLMFGAGRGSDPSAGHDLAMPVTSEEDLSHVNTRFGAGIWHFATYVDRYATDGYGDAAHDRSRRSISPAQVGDLSVVDLN